MGKISVAVRRGAAARSTQKQSVPRAAKRNARASNDDDTGERPLIDAFITPGDFFRTPGRKNHLIENYMPGPGSVTTIVAGPGVGKTTLIADLAFQVAYKKLQGKHRVFLGQRITQPPKPAIFIAREGHRQLKLLGVAWQQLSNTDFTDPDQYEPITVLDDSLRPKLDIKSDKEQLIALLNAFRDEYGNPGIIVLDTARKLLHEDENNSKAVTEFMQAAQQIATDFECSVICLHHTPKSGAPTARGSGAWMADTDCEWMLTRNRDKIVTIEVTKLKGFELPPPIYFTIESHETDIEDLDNPGQYLRAANIKLADAPKKKAAADLAGKAIAALTRTPEAKREKRMQDRVALINAAWEVAGRETSDQGAPYITRAALAEYLATAQGYSHSTIKQALKPSSDEKIKSSLIGPLTTSGHIEQHEHGWIIIEKEKPE